MLVRPLRKLLTATGLAGLLAFSAACASSTAADGRGTPATPTAPASAPATGVATGSPSASPDPSGDIVAGDLGGRWKSTKYGYAYIGVDGDSIKIVYEHNDGRVLGSFNDDRVTGWWTESPGRQPSDHAGDIAFTAVRTADGVALHGGRRFGTGGAFTRDWELVYVDRAVPADVAAVLAGPSSFVPHP